MPSFHKQHNFIFTYLIIYLLSLITSVPVPFKLLTSSTKIKHEIDFYEMSGIHLDIKARVHNMYFDATKF
jgi:hypothetical protein